PMLGEMPIAIVEPQGYLEMLGLLANARLVLTDSGGIQEKTTPLTVPCLTMRENTERPITVSQGTNELVGRDRVRAAACVDEILRTGGKRGRVPELWDGKAAVRIAAHLETWLAMSLATVAPPAGRGRSSPPRAFRTRARVPHRSSTLCRSTWRTIFTFLRSRRTSRAVI